jgi:hypothetical protein
VVFSGRSLPGVVPKRCGISTGVSSPYLGFDFGRCNRLRRKLEHRCFLTFKQVGQQHHGETRVAWLALLTLTAFRDSVPAGLLSQSSRATPSHSEVFGNGLCRHLDIWVHFDPHLIWQACKGYVERGNVLRFISH